ncbi:MAG TPA: NAD(P)/FAD-dependent oxidoreductase [Streptosporangiaceae bacterium]
MSIIRPPGQGAAAAPRVVIVGAGFAGLSALHALRRSGASVTLVDRNAYSTFQPLLYQVATAGLTSADVAYSLFAVARKRRAAFRLGEVTGLDTAARRALLADGTSLEYDYLIIASGVAASYFGIPGAAEHSFGLYTRRDAVALRNQLMAELERRSSPAAPGGDADLNITIAGGGATGVELAGTVAELRNIALPAAFPLINRERMRVRLVEQGPALLAPFSPSLRDYARRQLLARGVDVRLETAIKEVGPGFVLLADGARLPSDITVWAAGISAPPDELPGLQRGRGGRLLTGPDLRVAGQERVFAAGDVALTGEQPVAQLAQPAIQQGRHAAEQIGRLESGQATQPFSYHDKGTMATIGRRSAVVELPYRVRVRGSLAWLAWLGLHLVTLLGNRNRLAVLVNLSWRYVSWKRSGGIIIGDDLPRGRR